MRAAAAVLLAAVTSVALAASGPLRPGPQDKCPVCGMFVAKYPDWTAGARFDDGSYAVFDGPKDLFKFWFDVKGYLPQWSRERIQELVVSDYYGVEQIDARAAFYVIGSDVFGPMGKELVPFARAADAEEFRRDHHGASVLTFGEIAPAVLQRLE